MSTRSSTFRKQNWGLYWEAELGPLLLAKFDELLANELEKANVTVKVLRFRSSEVGRDFVIARGHGMRVPVAETINRNLHDEREMGANFRLIVIPTYTVSGKITVYQTKWVLVQADTGNQIWSGIMTLRKANGWNNDEAQESAHKLVNDMVIELRKGGLL